MTPHEQRSSTAKIQLLAEQGVRLGYPSSSKVIDSENSHLRELRVQSGGRPIRIFYAFDPRRMAALLIGGDKTGISDRRFYGRYVPIANRIYNEYIMGLEREGLL